MSDDLIVQVYPTTWHSTLAGVINVATPVVISVANHRWGGGSSWIDALAVFLAIMVFAGMANRLMKQSFRGTKAEAIEFIREWNGGR